LCFVAVCCFLPPVVSAHTLKRDKNIGIILHADPDDSPVAGVPSTFYVDIEDKSGRFNSSSPENCDCRLSVFRNTAKLTELPVTTAGRYNQLRYTFPQSGVYTVVVTGKPNGKGLAFQEFRADFEYFVRSGAKEKKSGISVNPLRQWVPYLAAAAGSAVVLMFVLL
jgi:hypothetical protein